MAINLLNQGNTFFFSWQAYEKYTTPNSPYDLGRKANFEQVLSPTSKLILTWC